jgi:hypothetical protein
MVFDGVGGFLVFALWVYCFVDVLITPESACRNLPKLAWVFIVLLLPFFGSIAWLIAGHAWDRSAVSQRAAARQPAGSPRPVAMNPDDDEEFLAGLRRRTDEQRRKAREQQDRDRPGGDTT